MVLHYMCLTPPRLRCSRRALGLQPDQHDSACQLLHHWHGHMSIAGSAWPLGHPATPSPWLTSHNFFHEPTPKTGLQALSTYTILNLTSKHFTSTNTNHIYLMHIVGSTTATLYTLYHRPPRPSSVTTIKSTT
jgi:hypothetical protein